MQNMRKTLEEKGGELICAGNGLQEGLSKLKNNNNLGNRVGNAKAQAKVYAMGNAGANPATMSSRTMKRDPIKTSSLILRLKEYLSKGCQYSLSNITANTKDKDKSKGKRLVYHPLDKVEFELIWLPGANLKCQSDWWGDKQEAAFQLLKQKLCSAPILALPKGSEDFIAYYDALKKGLGFVLMQRGK
ncbi:putative reverse transcriptase domain-containing protein [Tanacetum coccineum]